MKKVFWLALGFIGLICGAIGAVVPMFPVFPFLLLAAISFGKSSDRLYTWFIGTNLYKNNLESYAKGQGMTVGTKIKIMISATIIMAFGVFFMVKKQLYFPCVILGIVWICHFIYFIGIVKTYKPNEGEEELA